METDLSIYDGGAVKSLGSGRVGGLLVRYTTDRDPDYYGDFFTADTDFEFDDGQRTAVLYEHGIDRRVGAKAIGRGTMKRRDEGVEVEATLDLSTVHGRDIYLRATRGELGWSSGTALHRVGKVAKGAATWISSWPLGLDASLTPTPVDLKSKAYALKSILPVEDKQPLADQTGALLTDLDSLLSRVEDYREMKSRDNRKISNARRGEWIEIKNRLDIILTATDPANDPDEITREKLRVRMRALSLDIT